MILIVDDDPAIRRSLTLLLETNGYETAAADGPQAAMDYVRSRELRLVLLDMNFSRATSGDEGLTLLRQIRVFRPELPVILMTAWGSIALAVEGIKAGAADFITKPWDNGALLQRVAANIAGEQAAEHGNDGAGFDRSLIIGRSPAIMRVIEMARRVAATDAPVLITGENGTGKELVAETIHRNSARAGEPFVKVNLGGVPAGLFESEMFGHRRGAFTGAVSDRKGRFEAAHRGTIFLDEIGELDLPSQVKMLRVLQEQTFEPLGSSKSVRVNVRVISATNAPLARMVAERTFREDLYYRLNLIAIHLPPLRERPGDIPLLIEHFAAGRAEFTAKAVARMQQLSWPGNVRQLKNAVERAIIFGNGRVDAGDVELTLLGDDAPASGDNERDAIVAAIEASEGNISRAASILGLTRQALYRRMNKYGLRL